MAARILIADDEPPIRTMLSRIARHAGLDAHAVGSGRAAVEEMRRVPYDVLLLDLTMPEFSGHDVVNELREWRERPAVIVLTANAREDGRNLDGTVVQCILLKPFDTAVLVDVVRAVGEAVHDARRRGVWSAPPPVREFGALFQ